MKEKLEALIKDPRRCAKQNDKDANDLVSTWAAGARAVAGEQRRVIKLLRKIIREAEDAANY